MKEQIHHPPFLFTVHEEEGTVSLTECDKEVTSVTVPARVDGYPVTAIDDNAFKDCVLLTEVLFEDPDVEMQLEDKILSEVGGNSFMNCVSLTAIDLPRTVCVIGWGAFAYCRALRSVRFSPSAYVSGYVFSRCEVLEEVTPISYVVEGTFSYCAALKRLPVTDDLEEIEDDAFEHCDGLTEIVFPATLTHIGDLAFRGCRGLERVSFEAPDGWYATSRYDREHTPIDLSDPERNARRLARVDFDDGPNGWYKQK